MEREVKKASIEDTLKAMRESIKEAWDLMGGKDVLELKDRNELMGILNNLDRQAEYAIFELKGQGGA